MSLVPCGSCQRHLRARDSRCPFCGALRPEHASPSARPIVGRLSRAAVFAGLTACWTGSKGSSEAPPPSPPPPADAQLATDEPPPAPAGEPVLVGVVREKGSNAPLASALVELYDANGRVDAVNTDANGRYAFNNVVAGDYQIVVRYNTSTSVGSAQHPVTVRDRREVFDVELGVLYRASIPKPYGAPPARRRTV